MTPFLQLALALAIIITAAKVGGYLSYRIGQPSVLGELLVGILIGPTVLDFLHMTYFSDKHLSEVIHEMAEVGVLFLMFIAGMELHLNELARTGKVAALAGILGVLFPIGFGAGSAMLLGSTIEEATFVGLALAATSVSISAQTLMEMKVLRSRVGIGLLGAAVFDDILVVLGLSAFTALASPQASNGLQEVLLIVLRMALFIGIGLAVGLRLLPHLSEKVNNLPISQGLVSFAVVVMLLYSWAAEELGSMAAITGAFLAGLMFARSRVKERIEGGLSAVAYGLFVPVFFIDVGLKTNARELSGEIFWLFLVMSIAAVIGKIGGAGLGAYWSGFSQREALQLGIGMMSRGEVGLIVATVGIDQGFIPAKLYSAVVGVVIVTTLLTPPFLRASFRKPEPQANLDEKIPSGEDPR